MAAWHRLWTIEGLKRYKMLLVLAFNPHPNSKAINAANHLPKQQSPSEIIAQLLHGCMLGVNQLQKTLGNSISRAQNCIRSSKNLLTIRNPHSLIRVSMNNRTSALLYDCI